MKKLISGILICLMLTAAVFAESNAGINVINIDGLYSGEQVTVTVNYPEGYQKRGTVYIVPESGLSAAIGGDLSTAIFVSESEGVTQNPSYEFELPDGMQDGVYVIVTDGGAAGAENCSKRFVYNTDASEVSAALTALNGASDTKAAIEAEIGNAWYVDTDDSAWTNSAADTVALAKSLAGGSFESAKEVEDTIAVASNLINADSKEKILADVLHSNDILECGTGDAEFIANPDAVMDTFVNYLKEDNPSSKTEVQSLFREACAINCINNSTPEEYIYDLKAYNDVLGLDFNGDYKKVDTYTLATALAGEDYASAEQLRTKFAKTVASLAAALPPTTEGGGDGGNGGGFGGGGGGGAGGGGISAGVAGGYGQSVLGEIADANRIFSDVSDSHWAKDYIEYAYNNHIMSGDTDGRFRPDHAITREEWTKVVLNTFAIALGDSTCEFDDVKTDDWFYPYVARAYELRIINGMTDKQFGVGMNLTRQDAVVILDRAMKLSKTVQASAEEPAAFTDHSEIADYALDAVNTFVSLKVINGYEDGSFVPGGSITRAECAKIIKAVLDAVE